VNVFVNGIPWSLETHRNTPHLKPGGDDCYTHQAAICQRVPRLSLSMVYLLVESVIGLVVVLWLHKVHDNVFAGHWLTVTREPIGACHLYTMIKLFFERITQCMIHNQYSLVIWESVSQ
jgi:hypothetical protein